MDTPPPQPAPPPPLGVLLKLYLLLNGVGLLASLMMFPAIEAVLRAFLSEVSPQLFGYGMAVLMVVFVLYALGFIAVVGTWSRSMGSAYLLMAFHTVLLLATLVTKGFPDAVAPLISLGLLVLLIQSNAASFARPDLAAARDPALGPPPDRGGAFDLIFGRNRWRQKAEERAAKQRDAFVQPADERELDATRSMVDTARARALSGQVQQAFGLLDTAIVQGFCDVDLMQNDRALGKLREANPQLYQRLLDKAARRRGKAK